MEGHSRNQTQLRAVAPMARRSHEPRACSAKDRRESTELLAASTAADPLRGVPFGLELLALV